MRLLERRGEDAASELATALASPVPLSLEAGPTSIPLPAELTAVIRNDDAGSAGGEPSQGGALMGAAEREEWKGFESWKQVVRDYLADLEGRGAASLEEQRAAIERAYASEAAEAASEADAADASLRSHQAVVSDLRARMELSRTGLARARLSVIEDGCIEGTRASEQHGAQASARGRAISRELVAVGDPSHRKRSREALPSVAAATGGSKCWHPGQLGVQLPEPSTATPPPGVLRPVCDHCLQEIDAEQFLGKLGRMAVCDC